MAHSVFSRRVSIYPRKTYSSENIGRRSPSPLDSSSKCNGSILAIDLEDLIGGPVSEDFPWAIV